MVVYTAITFSPVQGFIEKSRKLRDLYGASLILSYLSEQLIKKLTNNNPELIISPALLNVTQGTPNRILLKGNFIHQNIETTLKSIWEKILDKCQEWIDDPNEGKLKEFDYHWHREWQLWKNNTWEIFSGHGDTIKEAMDDLESNKLDRDWTAINWIGESSSLTGTDAIAWYDLGSDKRNPNQINYGEEKEKIKEFYEKLSEIVNEYVDKDEKLSIPELTKRLITNPEIANPINFELPQEFKNRTFRDFIRKPQDDNNEKGQWTGWFMGDGDKVGDYLKNIAKNEQEIKDFTQQMRNWGYSFQEDEDFKSKNIGRVVYAGGDDFFGIIYNRDFSQTNQKSISTVKIYEWLKQLPQKWRENKSAKINENVSLSVGFIWAGHSIPQRDILQHCREAEQRSKEKGRNSITIRILFNNGQYVEWTTPWQYLNLLEYYSDRNGEKNWNHIYTDLAELKSRHAFGLAYGKNPDKKQLLDGNAILANRNAMLEFFALYFDNYVDALEGQNTEQITINEYLKDRERKILKYIENGDDKDYAWEMIYWLEDLITVGFYLFKDIDNKGENNV